ncbi:MAG: hypothetical protein V3U84_01745 [Thiotrichaceae bacterium]
MLRNFHNQGIADELYYFRDKDGREVDFLIPEGNLLNLYECKWHDESGEIPKNIKKIINIFGEETVKRICTLTTVPQNTPISPTFRVSNPIDL